MADEGAPSPITFRALLAGTLMAFLLGIGATYENLIISGSPLHLDYSTPAAVFLFFLFILLVNPLLALLGHRWRFSQAELVTVYLMGAVACTLPTNGLVCVLLPQISAGSYYATPENDWGGRVLPYMQGWLRVQDEQAVKWFYEGLPAGEALPWKAWLAPLAAWTPMLLAFFGASAALMVLVRRQWIASERLAFPLVQVPLAMIGEADKPPRRLFAAFFRTPAAWVGMAVPLLLYSQRALHNYFPFIPDSMPIAQYYFFWDDKFRLRLSLSYAVVGFGYLLSTKLGFSLWFLGLLTSLEHALMLHFGVPGTYRVAGNALGSSNLVFQGFGAMVALTLGSLWVARGHLQEIAGRAWRGEAAADVSELLTCRQAVLLLASSMGVMVVWLYLSGMSWWVAPVTLIVVLALMFSITRIVAEGGLAVTRPPIMPNDVLMHAFGSGFLGPQNTGALGMIQPWGGAMRTTLMAAVIHGFRLAESYAIINRRRLLWAVLLAAVVATAAASWNVLRIGYEHGALNLSFWFFGYEAATEPYTFAAHHIANPQEATAAFWEVAGLGALVQVLLTLAYQRFLWWPIHPIAFPVSATWTTHHLMPSIFLAWLIKTVVLRYGGIIWYQRTRPFFLGLILGHYVAGGLWIVIDGFTGKTANYLFYW